jgi:hypothetical protein
MLVSQKWNHHQLVLLHSGHQWWGLGNTNQPLVMVIDFVVIPIHNLYHFCPSNKHLHHIKGFKTQVQH